MQQQQQQQRLRASGFRPWSDSLPVLHTRHQRKHDLDDDAGDGVACENDDDNTTDEGIDALVVGQCAGSGHSPPEKTS